MKENYNEKSDQKVIEDFTGYAENTMNEVISSSAGKALIELSRQYFGKDATPGEIIFLYKTCMDELEKNINDIAPHYLINSETTNEAEKLEQVKNILKQGLEFIKKKMDEPVHTTLDSFTIFWPDKESGKCLEKYTVPLKEVLVLVWKALTDDKKFAHNYTNKDDKKKIQLAKKDQIHRLLSLFKRFILLENENGICHKGIRHELVFLLKRSYLGIDLIEDGQITTYSYIRENIFNEFINSYEGKGDKKRLKAALMVWLAKNDPSLLLNEIDEKLKEKLKKNLFELFIQHGTNPANNQVEKFINSAFLSLEFSCDAQKYPSLYYANEIFKASSNKELLQQAVTKMQEWIKNNYDFDDDVIASKIFDFHKMFQAQNDITKYQVLLRSSGKITDEINNLFKETQIYLETFLKEEVFKKVAPEIQASISSLNKTISDTKKDKLFSFIENFFSQWFLADNRSILYESFLNQRVQEKIKLSDNEINAFTRITSINFEKDITPYEINRVFLHALLVKPADWSENFFNAFSAVLRFVKSNFNNNTNILALNFKRDSFPPILLAQFDYLEDQYQVLINNKSVTLQRPLAMIVLPEHARTCIEVLEISRLLIKSNINLWISIYRSMKNYYEKILLEGFLKISDLESFLILDIIPKIYFKDFAKKIRDHVKSAEQLENILQSLTPDNRYDFLQSSSKPLCGIKPNVCALARIIRLVEKDKQKSFLESIGSIITETIKTHAEFTHMLVILSKNLQSTVISNLSKQTEFIAQVGYIGSIPFFLGRLHEESTISFIEYLNENHIKNQDEKTQSRYLDLFFNTAKQQGHKKIIDHLIREDHLFSEALQSRKLYYALQEARNDDAEKMINKKVDFNKHDVDEAPLLHVALDHGCVGAAKLMIEKNADLNTEYQGKTPLVLLLTKFFTEKDSKLKKELKELLNLMIEKGADLNPNLADGCLPLCLAINLSDHEMFDYLITKGSQVNIKLVKQYSPALMCAITRNNQRAIIKLLKAGAVFDLTMIEKYQKKHHQELQNIHFFATNFQKAKEFFTKNPSVCEEHLKKAYEKDKVYFKELMLDWAAGLNVDQRRILINSPTVKKAFGFRLLHLFYSPAENFDIQLVIDKTDEISLHNDQLPTPLLIALNENCIDTATALIEKNSYINSQYRNHTPLTLALKNYYDKKNQEHQRKYKTIIELLIKQGANLNPNVKDKNLPLNLAVSHLDSDMMSYLMSNGSVINQQLKNGSLHSQALSKAVLIGSEPEIILLLKSGAVLAKGQRQDLVNINPKKYHEVQVFSENFHKAKQLFEQQNKNYEQFFKKSFEQNKEYFRELILHWASSLDFERRKILADSQTVKKALGFELLSVLYSDQNAVEKTTLKNLFSNCKTHFKRYKDRNLHVKEYGFTNFGPYRLEDLKLQYQNLIHLQSQCLADLAELTKALGEKPLSRIELWTVQKYNNKSANILKNTECSLKKYHEVEILHRYEPLKRNLNFFSNYLDEHYAKRKHSKERIAYCVKFITDVDKYFKSTTETNYNLQLLKNLYEIKGLLLSETQHTQSKSYLTMLYNCAMTSRLARHVEHEIVAIEKTLGRDSFNLPELVTCRQQLAELDNMYGTAWRRFKTAIHNLISPVTKSDQFEEKRVAALSFLNKP